MASKAGLKRRVFVIGVGMTKVRFFAYTTYIVWFYILTAFNSSRSLISNGTTQT